MRKYIKFFLILSLMVTLLVSVSCSNKTGDQGLIKQIAALFEKESAEPSGSSGGYSVSTETFAALSGEEFSIMLVQWNLTKELSKEKNKWKSVIYGSGYVVNFEDSAYWYVESDSVYNLNDAADAYSGNNKKYYGIDWEKISGREPEATTARETQEAAETAADSTAAAETAIQEGTAAESSAGSVLKFSYTNILPAVWGGRIRMVEPELISFSELALEPGITEMQISGKITGSPYIKYCLNPDLGIYTRISAVIIGKNGNLEWKQDGIPEGEGDGGAYVKAGEVKNFQLVNSYMEPVNVGDTLIIIAYIDGGMPEDNAGASAGNIDKGFYGGFRGELN